MLIIVVKSFACLGKIKLLKGVSNIHTYTNLDIINYLGIMIILEYVSIVANY